MTAPTAARRRRHRPRPLSVGSLCTGYGGLDLAVAELFPTATWAWCADDDKHIAAVIAARFPGAPNLGDIRTVDWRHIAATAPVDIVTAGFPCQDISLAGTGGGITHGTRSGLWFTVLDAVRALRPDLLVVENVAALRRRGLDTVLAGLSETGYDTQWTSVRASDVGAPHQRARMFLTAWPAPARPQASHTSCPGRARTGAARRPAHRDHHHRHAPRHCTHGHGPPVPPPEGGLSSRHCCSPRPRTSAEAAAANHPPNAAPRATARPWPTNSNTGTRPTNTPLCGRRADDDRGHRRAGAAAAHPDGQRGRQRLTAPTRRPVQRTHPRPIETPHPKDAPAQQTAWDWGPYEAAVAHWADLTGRQAPHPVHPGRHGKPRLNPAFVEWMMGLPIDPGWVTAVPDLPRGAQLRALGNGVVPQQAHHALCELAADTAATGATNLLTLAHAAAT